MTTKERTRLVAASSGAEKDTTRDTVGPHSVNVRRRRKHHSKDNLRIADTFWMHEAGREFEEMSHEVSEQKAGTIAPKINAGSRFQFEELVTFFPLQTNSFFRIDSKESCRFSRTTVPAAIFINTFTVSLAPGI